MIPLEHLQQLAAVFAAKGMTSAVTHLRNYWRVEHGQAPVWPKPRKDEEPQKGWSRADIEWLLSVHRIAPYASRLQLVPLNYACPNCGPHAQATYTKYSFPKGHVSACKCGAEWVIDDNV